MSCEDRMLIDNYEVNSGSRPLRSTVFGRLCREHGLNYPQSEVD